MAFEDHGSGRFEDRTRGGESLDLSPPKEIMEGVVCPAGPTVRNAKPLSSQLVSE